ncbi:hypothetical protein [Daejeonella oryzae]|uniref:hypothetical protein n=1 Tax=Daejeonella oryzae TaxID=1122943 RepID=UPI0004266FB3|nr:hypothetical protein [Daejeonella oryzae]
MKNKWFTYFLGLIVLVVWGLIFNKILFSVNDDQVNTDLNIPNIPKEDLNNYQPKASIPLLLNYKDPFRLTVYKEKTENVVRSHKMRKSNTTIRSDYPEPNIIYSGYIKNSGSSNYSTMININGKSAIMKEGEVFDEVKLVKNYKDSIKISYQGLVSFIKLQ